jgi:GT2 family glycosyltransferase
MKIAILILHYNTPEVTTPLAESIPEAIIIDNGSDNDKRLKVKNIIIQLDKNYGFSKGWNEGIKVMIPTLKTTNSKLPTSADIISAALIQILRKDNIEPEYYWLLNSDIEIERKDIEAVKKFASTNKFDIFTPTYNCWAKECQPGYLKKPTELGVIELAAPVISAKVFNRIGLFDETFSKGYGVEYDFCYRARKAGLKVGVFTGASFYHIGSQTIQKLGFKDYVTQAKQEQGRGERNKYGVNHFEILHKDVQLHSDFYWSVPNSTIVYTTIFGDYDNLKPHAWSQIPAPWICVTDNPNLKQEGWRTVVVPKMFEDPRKNAKWYKLHPWTIPGYEGAKTSIFIDGTMEVTSEVFIEWMIIRLFNDMLMFRHPERDCIYEEAIVSKAIKYYTGDQVEKQLIGYSKHVKPHSGLWACGCLVRKHTPEIKKLMADWWEEQMKYTLQDQISFAYVCHKNKFKPTTLKENIFSNQLFKIIPHIKDRSMNTQQNQQPKEQKTPCSDRIRIINNIIRKLGYTSYLEIGQAFGSTFLSIQCKVKDGVEVRPPDPKIKPIFHMSSDQFFEHFEHRLTYDCIFIDGDHKREQVFKDITNSLDMLNPGGCLILHDTNPPNLQFTSDKFCFTAYQALIAVIIDPNLKVKCYTVTLPDDQGNGISIIFKSKKKFPIVTPFKEETGGITFHAFELMRNEGERFGWITEYQLYDILNKEL